jgi:putative membrane protein
VRLLWLFVAIWIALAIAPLDREAWLLENLIVFAAIPTLAWSYRRLRFRDSSYVALFAFFLLHEIGAHYTYAQVPLDEWSKAVFGILPSVRYDIDRNHYDRAIHLAYGLLVTPSSLDLLDARARATPFWRWLLLILFVTSHGALYELAEWAAALVFADDLGMAYLGTQGDVWDAQQDMFWALAGSTVTASYLCWRHPPGGRSD